MDESFIKTWNDTVYYDDTVYVLGDVSFHGITKTSTILSRLSGKKHLIVGNHDVHFLNKKEFTKHWLSIQDMYMLKHGGYQFFLCHYPIISWDRKHKGSIHVHGHTHGTLTRSYRDHQRHDVGVDARDYGLVHWRELVTDKYMKIFPKQNNGKPKRNKEGYRKVDHHG